MEYHVYILYSQSADRYYVGSTSDLSRRLIIHNSGGYSSSSTRFTKDWELFYSLKCETRSQAERIEKHIKNMRSRKYYTNLKEYSVISTKLKDKYG